MPPASRADGNSSLRGIAPRLARRGLNDAARFTGSKIASRPLVNAYAAPPFRDSPPTTFIFFRARLRLGREAQPHPTGRD